MSLTNKIVANIKKTNADVKSFVNTTNVVVYPNPVQTETFTVKVMDETNVQVVVSDLLGRVVSTSNGVNVKTPSVAGQYVVKVKTPKSTYVKNVVVK